MRKRFLTIMYYDDIGKQHLYKDTGSIPLALAKYYNWDSTFAYVNFNGEIHDYNYEKYVKLMPITKRKNSFFSISMFLLRNSAHYDVLNFYHFIRKHLLFLVIAKCMNPHIKVYVKTDMGREALRHLHRSKFVNILIRILGHLGLLPDLCTVETKKYLKLFSQTDLYRGRIQYLPNGFWGDEQIPADLSNKKENIILTVGRLGTRQKNTELLLDSFAAIPLEDRKNWKLFLVGSYTPDILTKAKDMIAADSSLFDSIIFTGNVDNKKQLNLYYTRAAVFCLPSRWEGSPLVLPEAMHHGCFPIVTNFCDAIYDLLKNGEYGYIVPNENKQVLIENLVKAMKNKDYIVDRGIRGKAYVDQYFDWEQIIKRLQGYLEDADKKK